MHSLQLAALTASFIFGSAQAIRGFNTGSIGLSGAAKTQSDFEAEFTNQQNLVGTDGAFTSARLYTMIQGDTTSDPISAIPAAMSTKTGLLLGMWASGGQSGFDAELAALKSAISLYGSSFADLVQGISVGSEDLYRITPTGIANDAGIGAEPDTVISYIQSVKSAISGTVLSSVPVGHVDTWTAWSNSSNSDVVDACDFLGMDAYPYYQTTDDNTIANGGSLFYDALDLTRQYSDSKPVWVTETGWPYSGPTENEAVPSIANARSYWEQVYCTLPSDVNVFWYTQSDADQASGVGSFGVVGSSLTTTPVYSLSCSNVTTSSSSSSSSASASSYASTEISSASSSDKTSAVVVYTTNGVVATSTLVTAVYSTATPVYPTGSSAVGAASATGTGAVGASATSSSVAPYSSSGAVSTVKLSLTMLAIPAVFALFA